jgi:SAM-dependent methyltransferase
MSTLPFLRNAHLILKPGGIVIHMVPVNGYFNHGYFQFSPCFFHDYYKQNGYDIVMNYLVYQQQSDHWRKGPFRLVDLGQGYGQNDQLISDRIGTFFVARKCPGSTAGKVPELQTMYQQITSARMEANKNNEHRMKIRAQQIIERTG